MARSLRHTPVVYKQGKRRFFNGLLGLVLTPSSNVWADDGGDQPTMCNDLNCNTNCTSLSTCTVTECLHGEGCDGCETYCHVKRDENGTPIRCACKKP